MASTNDEDALANPWAAVSPAESPSVVADSDEQQQHRRTSFESDDAADDEASKDVWRRSGSSDEGSNALPVVGSSSASDNGYRPQEYKQLQTAFDEFDPFRPDKDSDNDRAVYTSNLPSKEDKLGSTVDDKAELETAPPPTPSKTAASNTTHTTSPSSPTSRNTSLKAEEDQSKSQIPSAQAVSNPSSQGKPSTSNNAPSSSSVSTSISQSNSNNTTSTSTSTIGPSASSTSTSSGLINPLATIASAFRKRDFSNSSSKDTSRTSTPTIQTSAVSSSSNNANSSSSSSGAGLLQPILPSGKLAPAILIRDNEENLLIDESEKEAPPAVPSHTLSYTTASSPSKRKSRTTTKVQSINDNNDNNTENEKAEQVQQQEEQQEEIIGIQEEQEENTIFDFNFFLEQMRNKSAEPIAKYLRSFLREFSKKFWNVNDQIRVINDFLDFIAIKMRENEVWKNDSEREFDNAVEGMEKLVMNRVFTLTFVPALDPAQQATSQTDDLERDHVLSQRIKLFQWVNEEHLDLPQHKDTASFVEFAKQELRKINLYKAPRDKLICILNCCKVIFGLMRHLNLEDGADTFIPFLILVVLKSNPDHLISNVQYISRFRNPDRLTGENGYYLSSLNASISFIETMDSSSLSNIQQDEFEKNVENAIKNLPFDDNQYELPAGPSSSSNASISEKQTRQAVASTSSAGRGGQSIPNSPSKATHRPMNEKGMSHSASESSLQAHQQHQPPPRSQSPAEATRDFFIRSTDNLQKTVSKPLQALGKIFTEMGSESEMIAGYPGHGHAQRQQSSSSGGQTSGFSHGPGTNRLQQPLSPRAAPPPTPRGQRPPSLRTRSTNSLASPVSPQASAKRLPPGAQGHYAPGYISNVPQQQQRPGPIQNRGSSYQAADFLDDSIPAEEVQATVDRNYQANFNAKIDTLVSIFSGIERETLEIVLLSNGEDVERTIEGLLDMQ